MKEPEMKKPDRQKRKDKDIERRDFLVKLPALSLSVSAAGPMIAAAAFSERSSAGRPPSSGAVQDTASPAIIEGTGGDLLVEQLAALGVKFIFNCESSGTAAVWEAMLDRKDIQVITAPHEGAVASMAFGYSLASQGDVPFTLCDSAGFLNKLTTINAAWASRTPVVFGTERQTTSLQGGLESFEDYDGFLDPAAPFTKWRWSVDQAARIPELTRRAFQFAVNPPGGPVVLGFPNDQLSKSGVRAAIRPQRLNRAVGVAPDPEMIEQAARVLVQAKDPLLFIGSEVTRYGAQDKVVELAELLGMPVCFQRYTTIYSDFPSRHPLFLGQWTRAMRYPKAVDVFLNIGARMPFERMGGLPRGAKVVHVTTDSHIIGREQALEVGMIGDPQQSAGSLIDAVKGMLTAGRIEKLRAERYAKTAAFTEQLRQSRQAAAHYFWKNSPIAWERLMVELDQGLDENAIILQEIENHDLNHWFNLSAQKKQLIGLAESLGTLGVGAALGVKLALPDRQVALLTGDGAFLFGQCEMLWSLVRHRAPIIVIILNNRSYDHPRTRKLADSPKQLESGREMTSYLGDPDVAFTEVANAFKVGAELVSSPSEIKPALKRAVEATRGGEPYLLEVLTERRGLLADSNWHPQVHIAAMRKRKV